MKEGINEYLGAFVPCLKKLLETDKRARTLDGESRSGPDILASLNERFGAWGVGRHIYTGDVSIGLKGRIVFEAPGLVSLSMISFSAGILASCRNRRAPSSIWVISSTVDR